MITAAVLTTVLVIMAVMLVIAVILLIAEKFLVSYGDCSVNINSDRKIDVPGGDSLLSYLNENKIFIPSACGGKATCGFCKVQVAGGGGEILPTEEMYMTSEEQEKGMRLACQVKVRGQVDINIPEYLLSAEEFESVVEDVHDLTHDIKAVRLKILNNRTIDFKPGQYIQFKVPGTDIYRAYSVASPPSSKDLLDFTIRLVPGGLCSTYVHRAMEAGDKVIFTGPFGDFHLQEDSDKDIIAIGGGCGMAPIRSIVYHELEKGMPRKFYFFFGARGKSDLFFTEELKEIEAKFPNFKYIVALSEPKPEDNWDGETGFITTISANYIDKDTEKEAYLCGPPPMIDAAMRVFSGVGIKPEDVYFDKF